MAITDFMLLIILLLFIQYLGFTYAQDSNSLCSSLKQYFILNDLTSVCSDKVKDCLNKHFSDAYSFCDTCVKVSAESLEDDYCSCYGCMSKTLLDGCSSELCNSSIRDYKLLELVEEFENSNHYDLFNVHDVHEAILDDQEEKETKQYYVSGEDVYRNLLNYEKQSLIDQLFGASGLDEDIDDELDQGKQHQELKDDEDIMDEDKQEEQEGEHEGEPESEQEDKQEDEQEGKLEDEDEGEQEGEHENSDLDQEAPEDEEMQLDKDANRKNCEPDQDEQEQECTHEEEEEEEAQEEHEFKCSLQPEPINSCTYDDGDDDDGGDTTEYLPYPDDTITETIDDEYSCSKSKECTKVITVITTEYPEYTDTNYITLVKTSYSDTDVTNTKLIPFTLTRTITYPCNSTLTYKVNVTETTKTTAITTTTSTNWITEYSTHTKTNLDTEYTKKKFTKYILDVSTTTETNLEYTTKTVLRVSVKTVPITEINEWTETIQRPQETVTEDYTKTRTEIDVTTTTKIKTFTTMTPYFSTKTKNPVIPTYSIFTSTIVTTTRDTDIIKTKSKLTMTKTIVKKKISKVTVTALTTRIITRISPIISIPIIPTVQVYNIQKRELNSTNSTITAASGSSKIRINTMFYTLMVTTLITLFTIGRNAIDSTIEEKEEDRELYFKEDINEDEYFNDDEVNEYNKHHDQTHKFQETIKYLYYIDEAIFSIE